MPSMLSLARALPIVLLTLPALASARKPLVVLDPGHGGSRLGAPGSGRLMEKELSLRIAVRLRAALSQRGVRGVLTRERDVHLSLPERVSYANRHRPDLFLSIHANSMPTQRQRERTEGVETFFLSANASHEEARKTAARENDDAPAAARAQGDDTLALILADLQRSEAHVESSKAAYAVHQAMVAGTNAVDRGVHQAPFYVLMGVEAPAILVEVGYISHPSEGRRLEKPEYQQRVAEAIADGIKSFLEQTGVLEQSPAKVARP
jgi:N-acetylmuramoyl-L-alanine amidase